MKLKIIIFNLSLLVSLNIMLAQVGINNPLPDSSTVLDMSGGLNKNKGILLPTTDTIILVNNPKHGLLLFNPIDNEFYFNKIIKEAMGGVCSKKDEGLNLSTAQKPFQR
mgnify:CR=1 FL=1